MGGVLFPHRLVVEPSASLGLAPYICGLAADCPRLYVRGFQQFTQFSFRANHGDTLGKAPFRFLPANAFPGPLERTGCDALEGFLMIRIDGTHGRHALAPICGTSVAKNRTVLPGRLSTWSLRGLYVENRLYQRTPLSKTSAF